MNKLHRVHIPTLGEDIIKVGSAVPYEVDTLQKYDIGQIIHLGDKAFAYSCAKGIVAPNMGCKPYNHQDLTNQTLHAAAVTGDTQIWVHTSSNDGIAGVFTADFLKGGQVVVFPAAGAMYTFTRGIVASSAVASASEILLTLDAPIPYDLTTSATAEAIRSPWAQVCQSQGTAPAIDQGLCSCVGVPTLYATDGKYLWLQTWGFCWISPTATLGNSTNNNRGAWFQGDGSVGDHAHLDNAIGQYAGWVAANDYGGGQGAPFVYLMIAR